MNFPRFVFKNKGPLQRAGGSYSETLVENQAEMDAALQAGWFATLPEAIEAKDAQGILGGGVLASAPGQPSQDYSEPDDNSAPTRAELEAKAKELGIEFSPRIGDKKLLERIEEALKALEA